MRGFRFGVVVLVALALLFNDSPTLDGRSAIPPQLSTTQVLRSWDGGGLAIPDRSTSFAEFQAELKKLGGSRIVLSVDTSKLHQDLLVTMQDDVRYMLRESRIGYIDLTIRDGGVEVRIRKDEDLPRALVAFGRTPAQPDKALGGAAKMRADGDNMVRLTPTDAELDDLLRATVERSTRMLTRPVRINDGYEFGARQVGPNRIELLLPSLTDPSRILHLIPMPSKLSFRLIEGTGVEQASTASGLATTEVLYADEKKLRYLVQKRAVLNGEHIRASNASLDPRTRQPVVTFRLSAHGAQRLAQVTQANIGRSLAIELDGRVIAAPLIGEPISDGRGRIEGGFTVYEALELAFLMRVGILPAPLIMVEEEIVAAAK